MNNKQNRKLIQLIAFLMLLLILMACETKTATTQSAKPNIIFLMDDQHRHDAIGIVDSTMYTPALDKLAKEGIRFTQAVCQAPMCVASRNSMMFGMYPNQVGIVRNEHGLRDSLLPAKTLAQLFQDAGYETAGFGKTHWGTSSQPFIPSTRGFETRYIGECREEGAVMMIDVAPDRKERYNEEVKEYGGGEEKPLGYIGRTSGIAEGDHRDGWVFEQCLNYINNRQDERPLFLYLSFLKPHAGHNVPEGYESHYDLENTEYAEQPFWDEDHSEHAFGVNRRDMYINFWKDATEEQWKEMTLRYKANCSWTDHMFKRTLAALDEKNLLDNAIIIYVSDHGEMLGERYYRFNKYCLYESSVRVPFIISGKALPKELMGKEDSRNAELIDVLPTLLSAANIEIPQSAMGINLLDTNTSRQGSFCALHEKKDQAAFMWRNAQHKLILVMNRKSNLSEYNKDDIIDGEFYDLENDPQEWNNKYHSSESDPIMTRMKDELLNHLKSQVKSKI
ncbi:sulfatase family protein [Carboxylicivirga caseinilyticus]|uniref:sulfatase family protein n=1 Tax=Carboxylicivirga caseinilyticus TaxID=3417572 RepID=UPI003D34AC73|nr:sulfatase-like hydrolase/transferase [Marinilabiliaceae bacterium A049]